MALENIMGVDLERRVLITGLFGLVHGFGFSYGLQENFQFAGTHLLVSLFAFNIGIEIGQLMVLALMLPALALVRRYVLPGRVGMIILSAIVAHTGWHWMIERAERSGERRGRGATRRDLRCLRFWIAGILFAAGGLRSSRTAAFGTAPARLRRNEERRTDWHRRAGSARRDCAIERRSPDPKVRRRGMSPRDRRDDGAHRQVPRQLREVRDERAGCRGGGARDDGSRAAWRDDDHVHDRRNHS